MAARIDVGGRIDWQARIRERLAGTLPQHDEDSLLLPGLTREQSREYRAWFPAHPVPAAVLVPLVARADGLTVLLTERATELKNHAGQISFPGGRIEASDVDPVRAALREAREEIGLDPRFVSIAGFLPDHLIISGYRVTPVVGFVTPGFELLLDTTEVQDTFEVPLEYVFEPANRKSRRRKLGDTEIELCDIPYREWNIWGATAGMLVTLHRLVTAER
ncbi:MAG: NUDIX hydrolase [Steroidobacteraceae bacterium]